MEHFLSVLNVNDSIKTLIYILVAIIVGLAIGKIKIHNISLGTTFVLFVGIFISSFDGNLNSEIINALKDLGLLFFIFSIGLNVSPDFTRYFKAGGVKLNLLAVCIVTGGIIASVLVSNIFSVPLDIMAGIYSGAISSTPGMSAAMNMVLSSDIADTIARGYSLTYPIGVVIPIIACAFVRRVCKVEECNECDNDLQNGRYNEKQEKSDSVNYLFVFSGMLIGIVIGQIPIPIGEISFKLGVAGGSLLTSVLTGYIGVRFNLVTKESVCGREIMGIKELGILLFLATVGLEAGNGFIHTLIDGGYMWIVYALIIAVFPLILTILFARIVLKINVDTLIGVVGGVTTDTPALAFANKIASKKNSQLPSIGYTTVYPLTVLLRIFSAQLLIAMTL